MSDNKKFTKRTVGGYWGLGLICFMSGFIYSSIPNNDLSFQQFFIEVRNRIGINYNGIIFLLSIVSSFGFYIIFFEIKNKINKISHPFCEFDNIEYKLKDKEEIFYKLREKFLIILSLRGQGSDEFLTEEYIENQSLDPASKASLKDWLKSRNHIGIIAVAFSAISMIVFAILLPYGRNSAIFFAFYIMPFLIGAWFYAILFWTLRIKSFIRLSYYVLYPTILTIAVNLYFGLAASGLLYSEASALKALLLLYAFLIVTAVIEVFSYERKVKKDELQNPFVKPDKEKVSTFGFVITSFLLLFIAVLLFATSDSNISQLSYIAPYSSLLFAVAIALFLGIFEGWDSLKNMCLNYVLERQNHNRGGTQ